MNRLGTVKGAFLCAMLCFVLSGCIQEMDRPGSVPPISGNSQTPTPSPTASPTMVPTTSPTPTVAPTSTPTPTATPEPSPTPMPTPVPPTPTPTPTPTISANIAPSLDVRGPDDGTSVQSDVVVVYGFTDPGATLLINGEEAPVGDEGRFQLEVSLEPGLNELEIMATDANGNETRRTITVTSMVAPPQPFFLVVTRPEDQSVVSQDAIPLSGLTSPDAVVSVNGVSIPVEPVGGLGLFETTVRLEPGPNIINVGATSADGQVLDTILAVIYRP